LRQQGAPAAKRRIEEEDTFSECRPKGATGVVAAEFIRGELAA